MAFAASSHQPTVAHFAAGSLQARVAKAADQNLNEIELAQSAHERERARVEQQLQLVKTQMADFFVPFGTAVCTYYAAKAWLADEVCSQAEEVGDQRAKGGYMQHMNPLHVGCLSAAENF